MKRINFYTLLSHVGTGVSIFVGIGGAMWGFLMYLQYSFLTALAAAVIGLVPGLFMLIITEALFVLLEILKESRKQTLLLLQMTTVLTPNTADSDPAPMHGDDPEILSDH